MYLINYFLVEIQLLAHLAPPRDAICYLLASRVEHQPETLLQVIVTSEPVNPRRYGEIIL